MVADDYIDIKFDIFEHVGQRARIRKTLTVDAVIEEILKEFDDIPSDSPEKYAVYLKGAERPLNNSKTLAELDVQPQDELLFDHFHKVIRQMLSVEEYASLQDEKTGKTYDIQWQPAVIGRPSTDMDHNIILAVNVQLLPEGKTISRRHAQITLSEGRYYIEPLAEKNPVFLNGKELQYNKRKEIKSGDKLMFGHQRVAMTFKTQLASSSYSSRPHSTPRKGRGSGTTPVVPEPLVTLVDMDLSDVSEEIPCPTLVIEASADKSIQGQSISISNYPYQLGRSHPLLKSEKEVSRLHAEISYDQSKQQFFITDLQSTNGVIIDQNRIHSNNPVEIKPGNRIGLGNTLIMRFEI